MGIRKKMRAKKRGHDPNKLGIGFHSDWRIGTDFRICKCMTDKETLSGAPEMWPIGVMEFRGLEVTDPEAHWQLTLVMWLYDTSQMNKITRSNRLPLQRILDDFINQGGRHYDLDKGKPRGYAVKHKTQSDTWWYI